MEDDMTATRLIPAIALGALFATHSDAFEAHVLSHHGDWTVHAEVYDDGKMGCAAYVDNHDSRLDLTMTNRGEMQLYVIYDNSGTDVIGAYSIDFVIEGVKRWQLSNMYFTEVGARFEFATPSDAVEFMVDVQRGQTIKITAPDRNKALSTWSLNGSRAAIDGLFDCFRKISGVGA
jgi:hypothetical protein